jgi:hypothetical protein
MEAQQGDRWLVETGVEPEPVPGAFGTNHVDPCGGRVGFKILGKEGDFARR